MIRISTTLSDNTVLITTSNNTNLDLKYIQPHHDRMVDTYIYHNNLESENPNVISNRYKKNIESFILLGF